MRIKEILREKGITQSELAKMMNVSLPMIKQTLNADSVTTATLERIAKALDVPLWHLFVSPAEASSTGTTSTSNTINCPHCGGKIGLNPTKE